MHRTAKSLLLFTIIYNIAEGVVAIWAGIAAGSISLVAFGADSYLEVAAASVVYWRLAIRQHDDESGEFEERIEKFIGWTFLVLAAAVVFQAVVGFANRSGDCFGDAHACDCDLEAETRSRYGHTLARRRSKRNSRLLLPFGNAADRTQLQRTARLVVARSSHCAVACALADQRRTRRRS
jgi:class 3 adenylate cyclase